MSEEATYTYRFIGDIVSELCHAHRLAGPLPVGNPASLYKATVGDVFAAARAAIDDEGLWSRFPDSYIRSGILPEPDEESKRPAATVRDRLVSLLAQAGQK